MPKRKCLNIVRVQSNNQDEASLPSSPSINNEVEPSQQPTPSRNNASESNHQHAILEETNSNSRAPSPPPRKPKGPTFMSHVWELDKGVKVNVIFDANCHLAGKEGCTLTRILGTIARKSNVAPINYKEWRDMPQIYKDDMWKIIKEQLKNYMSESTSSANALEETTSWQDDVFSKVKGSDKKRRVHCLGKVLTSKKSIPSTSTNGDVEERLSMMENILSGLMQLMKARFLDENVIDILQAANQLGAANILDREVPHANSGQGFSPNNRPSSQSSHHLLSRQNETFTTACSSWKLGKILVNSFPFLVEQQNLKLKTLSLNPGISDLLLSSFPAAGHNWVSLREAPCNFSRRLFPHPTSSSLLVEHFWTKMPKVGDGFRRVEK
ncbi:hypothetical protein SLEP1_g39439 [Rubroshorea leprosula]|uniref:Uncharacterized protein n=1 Tax=Rubroshorea leprosula TaxID=152421 RepID=A0AAV5L0K8_9ROSI|nr:hypothetical protein SLEP1_g39439 [Rubroshorea leprosula]